MHTIHAGTGIVQNVSISNKLCGLTNLRHDYYY